MVAPVDQRRHTGDEVGTVPRRRRARLARRVLVTVFLLLLALVAWAAVEARRGLEHGRSAEGLLRDAVLAVRDGDVDEAGELAREAGHELDVARDATDSVPLRLAGWLPVVGDDVRAVRTITGSLHEVVDGAVIPLSTSFGDLMRAQRAAPAGTVAVAELEETGTVVHGAAGVTAQAREAVEGLSPTSLLPPLRDPVSGVVDAVVQLDEQVATADAVIAAGVRTLAADEPTTYLLAAQNLAEARPTGGIIGSWGLVRVDQGRISLEETGANDDLSDLVGQLPDLPDDVEQLYGHDLALSQNVNLSPDFPMAASLLTDLWTRQGRVAPDGVIGVDPVALARILGVTGPVESPGGPRLDRHNLVRVVQEEVYSTYDERTAERQAYLGGVTASVFDQLVKADWTDPALGREMAKAVLDRHAQVWSAEAATQELLVELGAAGELAPPGRGERAVRVHLTNADGSKLDQFLDVSVRTDCGPDGPQVLLGLTNDPPADLPWYSQSHVDGLAPLDHRLIVALYLPPDRGLAGLAVDGRPQLVTAGTESGWTVARATVDIAAGTTTELRWSMSGREDRPDLVSQPLTRAADLEGRAEPRTCAG